MTNAGFTDQEWKKLQPYVRGAQEIAEARALVRSAMVRTRRLPQPKRFGRVLYDLEQLELVINRTAGGITASFKREDA